MKKLISAILAVIIVMSCFCMQSFADEVDVKEMMPYAYGYVKPASLNVRKGPGTSYERIGGLNNNDMIFILEQDYSGTEYWYLINYNGTAGYVMASEIFYSTDHNIISYYTGSDSVLNPELDPLFITNEEPVKTGYTFKGWSLTKGSDTVDYKPMDKVSFEKNTMLYAVWQAPTFPNTKSIKVSYKSRVSAFIEVDNVPYDCRINVNGNLSAPQEAGCGRLSDVVIIECADSDTDIKVFVTNNDGNKIDNLECTLTVKSDNGIIGKIKAFFKYIFSGFIWEGVNVYFINQ